MSNKVSSEPSLTSKKRKKRKPRYPKFKSYGKWPTYQEAKVIVLGRKFSSRISYRNWWKSNKIQFLPLNPERVYTEEWEGWCEFLGNMNNSFEHKPQAWRPYWEAVRWVQASEFTTWTEWRVGYDAKVPKDIPKYPYAVYPEYDVNVWFGKTIMNKVNRMDSIKHYWIMISIEGEPSNVIWFIRSEVLLGDGWKVLRKWEYEGDLLEDVWRVIEGMSVEYNEREQRLCSNVPQLMYELDKRLLIVR